MTQTQTKPGRTAVLGTIEQSTPGPSPQERETARRQDRMRHRLRHQAAPHYTIALLVLSASAARAASYLTGEEQAVALTVASAAFVVSIVAGVIARRRIVTARARRWAYACITATAGWLTTITALGLSWDAIGLLTVLGYALALPWWRQHRIPNAPATPRVPEPEPVDTYAGRYATAFGDATGPLQGTWLTSHEAINSGHRYVLQLVPGKHSIHTVLGLLPLLRTGLQLIPNQDLVVERHPVLDESCLLLTIVTKSPALTADKVPWPGPTYDPETGTIALGPFIDGEGIARWRLFGPNSMYGGFLCGTTDSGKSRMLESIALAAAATGCVVWFGDPQGGASSPWLASHADHYARDTEGIAKMLLAALLVKELRQAENALYGWEGFTHSDERPGLLIIIDESHAAFANPLIQKMATTIARECRKVGIALIAASQVGTLDAFGTGQGADALRSCITAGNLVLLRTTSRNTKDVLPGVDVDPTSFPVIPGYAYRVDTTRKGRSAPLRGYYLDDQDRDAWGERITWHALDPGAGNAAGVDYLKRKANADADRRALAARVAALRGGMADPDKRANLAGQQMLDMVGDMAHLFAGAATTPPVPETNNAAVIAFPTWPGAHGLTDAQRAVLAAIGAGHTTPAAIHQHTGISQRHVYNVLDQLMAARRVARLEKGQYAAVLAS